MSERGYLCLLFLFLVAFLSSLTNAQEEVYERTCGFEGLLSKAEVWGTQAELYFQEALTEAQQIIAVIQSMVKRAPVLPPTKTLANLTAVKDVRLDTNPNRLIDMYITNKNFNGYYSSFAKTAQFTAPIRTLTEFCTKFHSNSCPSAPLASIFANATSAVFFEQNTTFCPSYCFQSGKQELSDSLYNFHLNLASWGIHLQTYFLSQYEQLKQNYLITTSGISNNAPVRPVEDLLSIIGVGNYTDWDYFYTYIADPKNNPSAQPIWSAPYDEPLGKGKMRSLISPIYISGAFHGVYGSDIYWSNTLEFLRGAKATPKSFYLIMDANGVVWGAEPRGWTYLFGSKVNLASLNNTLKNSVAGNFSELLDKLRGDTSQGVLEIVLKDEAYAIGFHKLSFDIIYCIFSPSKEVLTPATFDYSPGSFDLALVRGDKLSLRLEIQNTGQLELEHAITFDFGGREPWISLNNSATANQTVITSPNSTLSILLQVDSSSLNFGSQVTLIRLTTTDRLNGFCFQNISIIKVSSNTTIPIDTWLYVHWESGVAIFFIIVNILAIIFSVILIIMFMIYYEQLKTSSVPFCILITFGSLLVFISVFFWVGKPTKALCNLRVWFGGIGASLILGCFTAKNYRIWKIFSTNTYSTTYKSVSDQMLTVFVTAVLIPEIIFLIVWSSIAPLEATYSRNIAYLSANEEEIECNCSDFKIWISVFFALKAPLVFFGCFLAVSTREIQMSQNESKMIAFSMYNILFLGLVVILVIALTSLKPDIRFVLVCIGLIFVTLSNICVIFLPKFYQIFFPHNSTKSSSHGSHFGNSTGISTTHHG